MTEFESPDELRRKAAKCEELAGRLLGADCDTLLLMAEEYREMADRLERGSARSVSPSKPLV